MEQPEGRPLEAQLERNFRSDMRSSIGCPLAFGLVVLSLLIPLGLASFLISDMIVLNVSLGLFSTALAAACYLIRHRLHDRPFWRVTVAWMIPISAGMAILFLGLAFGE